MRIAIVRVRFTMNIENIILIRADTAKQVDDVMEKHFPTHVLSYTILEMADKIYEN